MKYVCNDIVKPFKVKILHYVERLCEMYDLAKYLPPPWMKGESEMATNWSARNEQFTISDLRLAIKDELPKKMRGESNDHPEDYRSLTYEDLCNLLSTIEVKDERKIAAVHIKKIASARAASLSDGNKSVRITRRKKAKTGVLSSNKSPRKTHYRHHGAHRYCVHCKKAGMPEHKYTSHSSEYCTGVCTKRFIKEVMGGPIVSRTHALQQHKNSENK